MSLQVLFKILKSEKVSERNKQRIKLKDFGYVGLVCFLDGVPVTMTTVRCLYERVLATGETKYSLLYILAIYYKELLSFNVDKKNNQACIKLGLNVVC